MIHRGRSSSFDLSTKGDESEARAPKFFLELIFDLFRQF